MQARSLTAPPASCDQGHVESGYVLLGVPGESLAADLLAELVVLLAALSCNLPGPLLLPVNVMAASPVSVK